MSEPTPETRINRLELRDDALTRELRELRRTTSYASRAATLRIFAVGILVLTVVPWLGYSPDEYDQGEWYSAVGLIGRGSLIVENRIQPIAVIVLVVATIAAMVVPVQLRFSWITGAVATIAVVVVLDLKHPDGDHAIYSWSHAPTLCLCFAITVLVVQIAAAASTRERT